MTTDTAPSPGPGEISDAEIEAVARAIMLQFENAGRCPFGRYDLDNPEQYFEITAREIDQWYALSREAANMAIAAHRKWLAGATRNPSDEMIDAATDAFLVAQRDYNEQMRHGTYELGSIVPMREALRAALAMVFND